MTREERLAAKRASMRAAYAANPEKFKQRSKANREANPERAKQYQANWLAANPGAHLAGVRAAYAADPDKFRARKRAAYAADPAKFVERNRKQSRKHYLANPGRYYAACAKRRAAKLQRTPAWSETELIRAFYEARPLGATVDHILPLQGKTVSGLHVLANLQYLSERENKAKLNKMPPEIAA